MLRLLTDAQTAHRCSDCSPQACPSLPSPPMVSWQLRVSNSTHHTHPPFPHPRSFPGQPFTPSQAIHPLAASHREQHSPSLPLSPPCSLKLKHPKPSFHAERVTSGGRGANPCLTGDASRSGSIVRSHPLRESRHSSGAASQPTARCSAQTCAISAAPFRALVLPLDHGARSLPPRAFPRTALPYSGNGADAGGDGRGGTFGGGSARSGDGREGREASNKGSSDGTDLHCTAAAAAFPAPPAVALPAAADEGAVAADGDSDSSSVWEGLSSMQLQVGTATLASASGSSRPVHRVLASGAGAVVAAPSQPPTLPAECRDGSAETAVVVTTFLYDQVILTNTCQQRAISRLSINFFSYNGRFRPYFLMPRLQFIGYGIANKHSKENYQFRVLPPLGAPEDSVIIPPGATFKFNTTMTLVLYYNITVIAAAFSP
ncbi:hypothetical protein CLOM_g2573 [Closterium sp. NIES-68]|nr:hypothetical protein CLOM_g2573 [Closterium sp. NIES-68]